MRIAVCSSASPSITAKDRKLAVNIGKYLAKRGVEIITGGCTGLPSAVVDGALSAGGKVVAYFPDKNKRKHKQNKDIHNNDELGKYHRKKFYSGFTHRSLKMILSVEAVIIFNGRIGTLSEFTIALEEGVKVLVIKKSGGISDYLEEIVKIANRELDSNIIFQADYKKGIDQLLKS